MKDFTPIAKYTYEHEYSVLRLLLEQANIQFFFKNETMVGMVPFYSNALGGIILFVHQNDKDQALKILEDFNSQTHLRII